MRSLFKGACVECFLDADARVFYHVWYAKPTSMQFREGLIKVLDEYIIHKKDFKEPLHWLADTRDLGVIGMDDQGWLEQVWNDMLFTKAEVRSYGVIIGNDIFARYTMEKFIITMQQLYADKDLNIAAFPDKESAYKWFREIDTIKF